jgi:DNA-binding protein YbaB
MPSNLIGPGGLDLGALLRQAKDAQQRVAEVDERRKQLLVTAESPDGLSAAQVDGAGRVVGLTLNPRAMRSDSQSLAESILDAIKAAYEQYETESEQLMGEALGDPGMYEKIRSGQFDAYEYLQRFGLNMPEIRRVIG